MWSWTLYRRIISCLCGKASVTSQKSVEKPEYGAVERASASASLCRNRALVETLDVLQFHLFDSNFQCWCCYCHNLKREGLYIQWRHSMYLVFLMPAGFFATSKIIHLLQFKLFLMIFKCIYVSFFTLTICKLNTYVLSINCCCCFEPELHMFSFFISGNFSRAEMNSDL